MKYSKKIFLILSCVFLSFTIVTLVYTYAKYLTSANGTGDISIARWNISVNNISIKNGSDISATITPTFNGTDNIAPNIIAPNAEGYFDLNFNFTNVDVSFEYTVTVTPNLGSSVQDLVATSYKIDEGPLINLDSGINQIVRNIDLESKPATQKLRVFIKWKEDEDSTMDNAADTQAALSESPALLDVNISFKQI